MDEETGTAAPPDRGADDAALATSLVELLSGLEVPDLLVEQHLLGRLEQVLAAAETVLGVDRIGLMLLDEHDRLQVVGASDPASSRLEHGQQQLGVGPGIDSLRTAQPVAVADLAASSRGEQPHYTPLWEWLQHRRDGSPTSPEAALVRSVLSVPVRARGRVVGTLNLARSRPGGWGERQLVACQAYADVIGVLLTLSAPLSDDSGRLA
ncbi:GAF domain-containing protein [Pseudonocardia cypriaca]|uniref:GAF domain-containing protein n=1 Tax=Pseudonocardia cypriaca TaxID=882449 RepID=A0A543FXG2_9PSEU|nr:GAF domain-containing protein [Pseudonocardia cypriaca]TQM38469.1 GAF domain-containing protein [Pseudonocardia cypriaca]